tara:strand:+ start:129 stop:2033 length:1905 start_codon:yes stop_codon:yes gene_type:complete
LKNIYRTEIDGLRGISVIAVILYHSGLNFFKSGYLGVDVFFIISGYLITKIILNDVKQKKFSFVNFFERRIRRILPLLFFICLAITPFAWYFFSAVLLESFGETLVSISLFSSNILFFLTAGYFNLVSELKPLIHTWSLSVEEQFYIIFPFFFIMILKYDKKILYISFILILILSFLIGLNEDIFVIKNVNYISLSNKSLTSFFLLPGRIWQLLLGGLVAIYLFEKKIKNISILSLLGLVIVVYSLFVNKNLSDSYTINSLLPSIGAVLILLFTAKDSITQKFLSNKMIVFTGLISYSLYLWHQPIFSFLRIYSENINLSFLQIFLSLVVIIFLSICSWKYVELPNRNKIIVSRKSLITKLSIMYLLIVSIGLFLHFSEGSFKLKKLKKIYPSVQFDKDKSLEDHIKYLKNNNIIFNNQKVKKTKILILGDSHSQDLFIALNQNKKLREKYIFSNIIFSNILKIDKNNKNFINSDVILMSYSTSHLNNLLIENKNFFSKLEHFKKLNDKDIWFTTSSLYFPYFGNDILSQMINKWHLLNKKNITKIDINKKTYSMIDMEDYKLNKKLENMFIKNKVPYLDKMKYICPDFTKKKCHGITKDFQKIYFDGNHTTLEGAKFFGDIIFKIKWLDKIYE